MDKSEKSDIEVEARQRGLGTLSDLELNYIESEIEFAIATSKQKLNEGQLLDHQDICVKFRDDTSSEDRKKAIVNFTMDILGEIL